ncbi:hypothetical protein FOMPIDRAFT_1052243, partial [Fomitopsis schrenkii]
MTSLLVRISQPGFLITRYEISNQSVVLTKHIRLTARHTGKYAHILYSFAATQVIDLDLLIKDAYSRNFEYLIPFLERGIRGADLHEECAKMDKYYARLTLESVQGGMFEALNHRVDERHVSRIADLESMPQRSANTIWWLLVQHGLVNTPADINVIDTGSHPTRIRLVRDVPRAGWASRASFSDDGSRGMEVANKMALRAYAAQNHAATAGAVRRKDLSVLGLKGCRHGDTIGAMDACEEGMYTCEWHDAKGYLFDPPTVANKKGRVVVSLPSSIAAEQVAEVDVDSLQDAYHVPARLKIPLAQVYRDLSNTLRKLKARRGAPELAALVLEPLVLGAGGMIFVDPLFQRVLIDTVRASDAHPPRNGGWFGLPVILDEVFVGLYRLGLRTTGPLLGVNPDIS